MLYKDFKLSVGFDHSAASIKSSLAEGFGDWKRYGFYLEVASGGESSLAIIEVVKQGPLIQSRWRTVQGAAGR